MYEKRRAERLTEENEITITVVSKEKLSPNKTIIYDISKDISSSGARIQTNAFLPVDTLLKIQLTLKEPLQLVTVLGKVKWTRSIYADESFEAGLEFIDTSSEAIRLLADHVSQTQKKGRM